MAVQDLTADMLTRIRNAVRNREKSVVVLSNKLNRGVAGVLKDRATSQTSSVSLMAVKASFASTSSTALAARTSSTRSAASRSLVADPIRQLANCRVRCRASVSRSFRRAVASCLTAVRAKCAWVAKLLPPSADSHDRISSLEIEHD